MLTPLRNAYYLSFPVVMGAVLSNRMAARLSGCESVHWATPVVLALVVFMIYTVDRLFDVRRYKANPTTSVLTARHRFHAQYTTQLWRAVAVVAALTFILLFFLPGSVIRFGLVLGGLCTAYVAIVFRLPAQHPALLLKEPIVALLYSAGVWGSVWVQCPGTSGVIVTEWMMFTAIAFQNLLLFSVMEQREMPAQPDVSLATELGADRADTILRWLTFGIVLTGITTCFVIKNLDGSTRFAQRSALMLALMSLTLYVIQRYPAYFLKNERYRWIGDGVFWMPALVL